jgi:hypothetical protein
MDPDPPASTEESDHLARELIEFLNEVRVVLPGVQVLFGFLLAVPFTDTFRYTNHLERTTYFAAFLCSAVATGFLLAPSLYHRLHFRRDVADKELMLRTFNRLVITGGVFVAAAMTLTVFTVTDLVFPLVSEPVSGCLGLLFIWLWYGLPLSRRQRERGRTK